MKRIFRSISRVAFLGFVFSGFWLVTHQIKNNNDEHKTTLIVITASGFRGQKVLLRINGRPVINRKLYVIDESTALNFSRKIKTPHSVFVELKINDDIYRKKIIINGLTRFLSISPHPPHIVVSQFGPMLD